MCIERQLHATLLISHGVFQPIRSCCACCQHRETRGRSSAGCFFRARQAPQQPEVRVLRLRHVHFVRSCRSCYMAGAAGHIGRTRVSEQRSCQERAVLTLASWRSSQRSAGSIVVSYVLFMIVTPCCMSLRLVVCAHSVTCRVDSSCSTAL